MAPRFSATSLDLSRLDRSALWPPVSFNGIVAARLADLRKWMTEKGIPFDTEEIEAEVSASIQEAGGVREQKALEAKDQAQADVLVAFAHGIFLDRLGDFYGTARFPGESDERYRRRIQLAPEAFSTAGSHGAYVYHALASDSRVLNADVWSPKEGRVVVAIQSTDGNGIPSEDLLRVVRAHLNRPDVRPLTDVVLVRGAAPVFYTIDGDLYVLDGPDHAVVKAGSLKAVEALTLERRSPGRDVPRSAIYAAASTGPVDKVVLRSPAADVVIGNGQVAICQGISFKVITYGG
jgi:phage-related baseplate assembly protein